LSKNQQLIRNVEEKNLVKIIAGIDNFDLDKVEMVVKAAEKGGANAVDVAARAEIVSLAKSCTSLPVFASSLNPNELYEAVQAGADAVEVGNFDALYRKGLRITSAEIIDITEKTLALIGKDVFISVTVPGHIEINEQIELAQKLEEMGVDIIQTEGAAIANVQGNGARGLVQQAEVSIANTIELARNVEIPVMTASGITSTTVAMAFAAGASAVGVGSFVNKCTSSLEMTVAVMAVVEAVGKNTRKEMYI